MSAAALRRNSVAAESLEFPALENGTGTGAALPSGTAIKLYRKIQHQARKIDPDTGEPFGYCFAWYETYKEWMNFANVRHIYRLIKELLDFGWIEKQVVPGVRAWLRPLIEHVPEIVSHTPRPPEDWKEPLKASVPSTRTEPHNAPIPVAASPTSRTFPTKSNVAMSGGKSGVTSGVPYNRDSKIDKDEKQKGRKHASQALPSPSLPPEAAPVVVLMHKCEIAPGAEGKLLSEIPLTAMKDACVYTLRRAQKGLSAGAGYAIGFARNLATGAWKFPRWYLQEIGMSERQEEREVAQANRVVSAPKPKKPVPADWLPGVSEQEARKYLNRAYDDIRLGTQHAINPLSDVVRDRARLLWQLDNKDKPIPWIMAKGTLASIQEGT